MEHVNHNYKPSYKSFQDFPRDQLRIPIAPFVAVVPDEQCKGLQGYQRAQPSLPVGSLHVSAVLHEERGAKTPCHQSKDVRDVDHVSNARDSRGGLDDAARTGVEKKRACEFGYARNVLNSVRREHLSQSTAGEAFGKGMHGPPKECDDARTAVDRAKQECSPKDPEDTSKAINAHGTVAVDVKQEHVCVQTHVQADTEKPGDFGSAHVKLEQHPQLNDEQVAHEGLRASSVTLEKNSIQEQACDAVDAKDSDTADTPVNDESMRADSRRRLFKEQEDIEHTGTNQDSVTDTAIHKSSVLDFKMEDNTTSLKTEKTDCLQVWSKADSDFSSKHLNDVENHATTINAIPTNNSVDGNEGGCAAIAEQNQCDQQQRNQGDSEDSKKR